VGVVLHFAHPRTYRRLRRLGYWVEPALHMSRVTSAPKLHCLRAQPARNDCAVCPRATASRQRGTIPTNSSLESLALFVCGNGF